MTSGQTSSRSRVTGTPAGTPTGDAPGAGAASRAGRALRRLLLSEYFVLLLSVLLFVVLLPFIPRIATAGNFSNMLSNFWPLLAIAIGQTYVMILGGIDLSQIAVVAVTSVLGAAVMTSGVNPTLFEGTPLWGWLLDGSGGPFAGSPLALPAGLLTMLVTGALIGAFTGAVVAMLDIPSFMMSLVGLLFFSAFAVWLTRSENIGDLPPAYHAMSERGAFGFLSFSMLIAGGLAVVAHLTLSRTVFGRWLYATGTNLRAAVISGVPVRRVILVAYIVSGVCAAIGSILYSARLDMGRPAFGDNLNLLLDVVGATVIGGTSLFGGRGKILWTVFGVILFVLLSNALDLLNLSFFTVSIVKGCVILAAAFLDVKRREVAAR